MLICIEFMVHNIGWIPALFHQADISNTYFTFKLAITLLLSSISTYSDLFPSLQKNKGSLSSSHTTIFCSFLAILEEMVPHTYILNSIPSSSRKLLPLYFHFPTSLTFLTFSFTGFIPQKYAQHFFWGGEATLGL